MAAEVIPLGDRLRRHRVERGLTQAQAARELDVARTAYRLWEMEAARPAPDRWRSIARWLGISMTVLLLAEQLIDEQEARDARQSADAGEMTDMEWDAESDAAPGDYFSQERSMIATQARTGSISPLEAASLRRVLARVQAEMLSTTTSGWHAGNFRKRFPNDASAPALARAALTATAVGVPRERFHDAALLLSELVTNSVRHTESEWVEVSITLGADTLRLEVSDQSAETIRARTPDDRGGWGLRFVAGLATRWGVERHAVGKTIWVELDLATVP